MQLIKKDSEKWQVSGTPVITNRIARISKDQHLKIVKISRRN